jgi:hypothetical protein
VELIESQKKKKKKKNNILGQCQLSESTPSWKPYSSINSPLEK